MASFCGFCGAKAIDDRSTFCADCGGKLEQSVDAHAPVSHTQPLPAIAPASPGGNVVLSRSFTNLLSQEASIGKEISPVPVALLADGIDDPRLAGDTLQEVDLAHVSP